MSKLGLGRALRLKLDVERLVSTPACFRVFFECLTGLSVILEQYGYMNSIYQKCANLLKKYF